MARKIDLRALGFALVGLWAAACGGTGADAQGVDDVELQQGNLETSNALTANALTANALTANALTANALTANALTANALTANALTANGLKDPLARQLMKYVVSCALPEDQTLSMSIDGKTYKFPGSLGLAPQWGKTGGKCDESCQRWVSACVLSRVDFLGIEMPISIRGAHPALRVTFKEFFEYSDDEATYFGNIFQEEKEMYACLAPDEKQIERVCGDSIANCPMKVVGSCAKACSYRELTGGFVDCSSSGKAKKPESYRESVTVFLPKPGR
jgi:hypothetical protein